VLQSPSEDEQGVASTSYPSMQALKLDFTLIDISDFQRLLAQKGFQLIEQQDRSLPSGKALWLGVFAKSRWHACDCHRTRRHSTGFRRITDIGKLEPPDPA
jgi:hypothetical protein